MFLDLYISCFNLYYLFSVLFFMATATLDFPSGINKRSIISANNALPEMNSSVLYATYNWGYDEI